MFAALFGFGGSFISLAMSKTMAKRAMGVQVIDPQTTDATGRWLLGVVEHHARTVGRRHAGGRHLRAPDPNAFATGASRNAALVAVSTGLLQHMGRDEVEAVLGHEMTHVANGDMVTLALLQGVVNTFVIFLSRVIGGLLEPLGERARRRRLLHHRDRAAAGVRHPRQHHRHVVLAPARVPRRPRRRAAGRQVDSMIAALEDLKRVHEPLPSQQFAAFGIAEGPVAGGLKRLFMSHPPLDERIAALRALNIA